MLLFVEGLKKTCQFIGESSQQSIGDPRSTLYLLQFLNRKLCIRGQVPSQGTGILHNRSKDNLCQNLVLK